ncbi:MAG: SH3 domain-containing protein [Planctomycetaceae bacterium]|nr:MAG: SH3 domain-containing protein [Planctomycetaceae bacterium]
MRKVVLFVALLLAFACTAALAQEKRWVTSEGTTLKKDASVTSEDVAPLAVGAELAVVEASGRWMKVRTGDGKVGWVYAGRVVDAPPAAEVSGGEAGIFGGTMQQSQIETAKADSARSIRGLSPEVSQYAKQRGTPEAYKKELDRILARKVTAGELKAFLRAGKIGEYAQ